jgi:hypothetical protein
MLEYLAIKSAYVVNKPDKIYFYYVHEPTGNLWETVKPLIVPKKIKPPDTIYGNEVKHYAHQSDVVRLEMLYEVGGIYLDMDTLCIKPFTNLLKYPCVMGTQKNRGLCNAVILSEPKSEFIKIWREAYKSFNQSEWDKHSVIIPHKLSQKHQDKIRVLGPKAFFFPLWNEMGSLLKSNDVSLFNHSYCVHYWAHLTRNYLKSIDRNYVLTKENNFTRFARNLLFLGEKEVRNRTQNM